ncbi:EF-hand calcium-binding domain-containing protein 11 isoform X1 [Balaenoptera ricei]|uniref:EF-hand calcium-binding domain-containing protein 11 isoform X1 n=1 Tax=Balaenoptera ricei TaxID=2746895 RepID=UPI0028BEC9DC|nr:EF-hand calcium-binding domain-containing protein 11 isoform X1 [Balaenoptera ricei]
MFFSQAGARPRMWEASPSEHKKWVEVFKACDEENKGYLSREDFKVAVVMLFGYKPSKIEADAVMSSVDPNTSGILLKEFLDIVRKKKEAQLYRNEIRHIFTAFDRHYRGYLTLEDFKKAFKQVAPKLSERIILEVFRDGKSLACVLSPSPLYTRGLHSSDETQNSSWYNTPSQFTSMSHTMGLTCSLSYLYQTFPTAVHCR